MDELYRDLGATRRCDHFCSHCGRLIDEGHVRLSVRADEGRMRWVYCRECEGALLEMWRKK